MIKPYTMSVGDFKALIWSQIKDLPDTDEISFGQVYSVTIDPEAD